MLLSGALLALFMTGFWLYCLTDIILTPAAECRRIPKPGWIVVIALTFVGGAVAWLIVREPARYPSVPLTPPRDPGAQHFPATRLADADDAVARHPVSRTRAVGRSRSRRGPEGPSVLKRGRGGWVPPGQPAETRGPDDDPEFLRALDRAIRGNSQAGGEG